MDVTSSSPSVSLRRFAEKAPQMTYKNSAILVKRCIVRRSRSIGTKGSPNLRPRCTPSAVEGRKRDTIQFETDH